MDDAETIFYPSYNTLILPESNAFVVVPFINTELREPPNAILPPP